MCCAEPALLGMKTPKSLQLAVPTNTGAKRGGSEYYTHSTRQIGDNTKNSVLHISKLQLGVQVRHELHCSSRCSSSIVIYLLGETSINTHDLVICLI